MAHVLPPLPYAYDSLEPVIDTTTMQIHHDKHHAAYVTNLNNALNAHADLQDMSAEALIKDLAALPDSIRMAVRNNAGGHVNHTMFWEQLKDRRDRAERRAGQRNYYCVWFAGCNEGSL